MTRSRLAIAAGIAALLLVAGSQTYAGGHTWRISEVFSNAAGNIQYVELGEAFGGPSEIGRYTFALDATAADAVETLLETLRRDARIRFAGRSYADTGGGGTVTESPGEAR